MSVQNTETSAEAKSAPRSPGWERLIDDWRRRPRFYVTLLSVIAVIAMAAFVVMHYLRTSEEQTLESYSEQLLKIQDDPQNPDVQIQRMRDLAKNAKDQAWEPIYLRDLANMEKNMADQASSQEEKLRHYEAALATIADLRKRFPDNPLLKIPWKVTPPGVPEAPPAIAELEAYCKAQLEFLQKHPFPGEPKPDESLSATLELKDPEGQTHRLKLRFFSRAAPHSVHTFLRMAREGHLTGTRAWGQERLSLGSDTAETTGIHLGSPMSKVAPEDDSEWGNQEKDRVGFTVPGEQNVLKAEKGRVALEYFRSARGSSPLRFVIYGEENRFSNFLGRTIFAEIDGTEGMQVLESLLRAPVKEEGAIPIAFMKVHKFEKPWEITGITVEGEAARTPDDPITLEPRFPEPPKKEEPKDGEPDETTPPPQDGDTPPDKEKDPEEDPGEDR